jgi:sulfide:quinone oxidoreductase
MKQLLILGAGTAGTMMAHHLSRQLDSADWQIKVVDEEPEHYYQPGFLFVPFGLYSTGDVVRPKRRLLPAGAEFIQAKIERIEPEANRVFLSDNTELPYDVLIVATGTRLAPEEVEGMTGPDWRRRIHEFYTLEGARALAAALQQWTGGRLVVQVTEMPIKCPVAPLEFAFLADWWLQTRRLRDRTELVYVTPLSGAFTKPLAASALGHLLQQKRIQVVTDFATAQVDPAQHRLISWDGREVAYDLLVTVPPNMGAAMLGASGLGDEFNYLPTDKHTLQAKQFPNIFAIGDATDLPTSKAGSVAHFQAPVLTANVLSFIRGQPLQARFDGHANCFVESGYGKAVLLDFNYDLEPVPGWFPIPWIGPLQLLAESRLNHWGKLAFKWIYWHLLLQGRPIPFVPHAMSLAGKKVPAGLLKLKPAA